VPILWSWAKGFSTCTPGGEPDVSNDVPQCAEMRIAELENELRIVRRRLADLIDNSPHAAIIHCDGAICYGNRAAEVMFGITAEDAFGTRLLDYVDPAYRADVVDRFTRVLNEDTQVAAKETVLIRADGTKIVVETVVGRAEWQGRPAVHVVMWDVSRRRRLEEELAWRAEHDPLTGLGNRRLLTDRLGTVATDRGLALLYVDLDGFKAVNDQFGHDVGDELLCHVSRRLTEGVDAEDIVARVGGDEFVIALIGIAQRALALRIGQRLKVSLEEPFDLQGTCCQIGASFGVAVASPPYVADDLIREADHDMLSAKRRRSFRVAR